MKVGFVILCYNNSAMVENCVEALLKMQDIDKSAIVIVDNKSPDGTGEKIKRKYLSNNIIKVLLNNKNTGYAKGNNVGYRYAKKRLLCDCIVILNSDVIIDDIYFISKLRKSVDEYNNAYIIAPDIINLDGYHSNPLLEKEYSYLMIFKQLFYSFASFCLLSLKIDYRKLRKRKKTTRINNVIYCGGETNFMPHGSCVIFTDKWVNTEEKAFYSKTFLFSEECFLHSYAIRNNKNIVYDPRLSVNHLEDGSIDFVYNSSVNKLIFVNKEHARSLCYYIFFRVNPVKVWKCDRTIKGEK